MGQSISTDKMFEMFGRVCLERDLLIIENQLLKKKNEELKALFPDKVKEASRDD
jgi:hypothetical protein